MATKKQKQELVDILKFTPTTVRILIQGYGGESYAGRVDREIYNYFKEKKIDIDEYASDWDGNFSYRVPDEFQPFPPGSPYECDGLFHASGAELSDLNEIRVEEIDSDKVLWVHNCGYSDLENAGVTVSEWGGAEIYEHVDEHSVVFWGGQGEKGCFFDAELVLRAPFDPKKLTIRFENCDDWYIINGVEYDGEEIDGSGGYSTTGKWTEHKWCLPEDEEGYLPVSVDEMEEEDIPVLDGEEMQAQEAIDSKPALTDWFDKETKPTIKGTYEAVIDAEWPLSGIRMVEWTGRSWKEDGEAVKIKSWRGLAENPNV